MSLKCLVICIVLGAVLSVDADVSNSVQYTTPTGLSSTTGSPFSSFLSRLGDVDGSTQTCVNWNNIADILLGIFRDDLKKSGTIRITIPAIEKDFTHKLAGINVKGKVTADHGWFSDLSSLKRTGNVDITTSGNLVTLKCALGLEVVQFGYDHYNVKVVSVGPSGRFSGTVGANSIEIALQIDAGKGDCKVELKHLRVVQLDDMKMTVTGFGSLLNQSVSKVATDAIQKRKGDIIKKIEEALSKEVKKKVDSVHCAQYFTMLIQTM